MNHPKKSSRKHRARNSTVLLLLLLVACALLFNFGTRIQQDQPKHPYFTDLAQLERFEYIERELQATQCTDPQSCFKEQILSDMLLMYSDFDRQTQPIPTSLVYGSSAIAINPITFSIPEENVVHAVPPKLKSFGTVVPGRKYTYVFKNDSATSIEKAEFEHQYAVDMSRSLFAITIKKHGWDCMRHLEILSAGCVPLFLDVDKAGPYMLLFYPKRVLSTLLKYPGLKHERSLPSFDIRLLTDTNLYSTIVSSLLDYTRLRLTTKAVALYFLNRIGMPIVPGKRILYLVSNNKIAYQGDYLCDSLLNGLKSVLGHGAVVDYPRRIPVARSGDTFWHEAYTTMKYTLYGKGFSYGLRLQEPDGSVDRNDSAVLDGIRTLKYDYVVFGLAHRGEHAYVAEVCKAYPRHRVVLVHGDDTGISKDLILKFKECAGHYFSREIDMSLV